MYIYLKNQHAEVEKKQPANFFSEKTQEPVVIFPLSRSSNIHQLSMGLGKNKLKMHTQLIKQSSED